MVTNYKIPMHTDTEHSMAVQHGNRLQPNGYRLRLQIAGRWLQIAGRWLQIAGRWLRKHRMAVQDSNRLRENGYKLQDNSYGAQDGCAKLTVQHSIAVLEGDGR